MQMILSDPKYIKAVIYLEGSPNGQNSVKALERAGVTGAGAVIILNDKLSQDATYSDTNIILQAMVLKNYL